MASRCRGEGCIDGSLDQVVGWAIALHAAASPSAKYNQVWRMRAIGPLTQKRCPKCWCKKLTSMCANASAIA